MYRNIALLTLIIFVFSLCTPILMQPKEAEAQGTLSCGCVWDWITNLDVEKIKQWFEFIKTVGESCDDHDPEDETWKKNTCREEDTENCPGSLHNCNSTEPPVGCGDELICECVFNSNHGKIKCTNESCVSYNTHTHRNCKGSHTCSSGSGSQGASYINSYW